jgi:2-amino-4-hydroxy-6-hydroxymethyldihydropteridine diphosphokinase
MIKIFLALGSNVGDRKANIEKAISLLNPKISNIKKANIFETKPVGFTEQENFLNTVISGYTTLSPLELLDFIKQVEKKIGRIERFRFGPREIDIDIIYFGSRIYKDQKLEIPHPKTHERDFVLMPLADIDPNFIHPKFNLSTLEMIKLLTSKTSIIKEV